MKIDDEFKSLNRKLSEEEYNKLEQSIIRDGIRDPLVRWGDILIDGHNRLEIAQKYNLEYKTINMDFANRDEVKVWILNNQLARRNLTPNEVSYYRGKIYESLKKQGKRTDLILDQNDQKLTSGQNVQKLGTHEEIGEKYGVSGRTIRRDAEFAKAVDKIELEVGSDIKNSILSGELNIPKKDIGDIIKIQKEAPELIEKIMSGEMNLSEASKEIRKKQRDEKIKQTIEQAKIDNKNKDDVKIIHGDMTDPEIQKLIEPESVDAIITDPPYPKEYLSLWEDLAKFAKKVLKPSGLLITYSGQMYLDIVMDKLSKELQYYWAFAFFHSDGHGKVLGRNILNEWKPILIYQKPPFQLIHKWISDTLTGGQREKNLHEWQQSVESASQLIDRLTLENQIILDPFAGSGTTLIAGLKKNRKVIGIEKEEANIEIIKERIDGYGRGK